jgi:hypothetical protein
MRKFLHEDIGGGLTSMATNLKTRIEQNRKNGQNGGERTAEIHGSAFLERRAARGGQTCLMKYGRDFYRSIRSLRTA